MTTGNITNAPMVLAPVRASTINQQIEIAAQITEVNSYMLPSGRRPTASPRVTTEITLATTATTVTTTPARPNRTPQEATGVAAINPIAAVPLPEKLPPEPLPLLVMVEVAPRSADRIAAPAVSLTSLSAPRREASSMA